MNMAVDAAATTTNIVAIVVTVDAAVIVAAATFVTIDIAAACSSRFWSCRKKGISYRFKYET